MVEKFLVDILNRFKRQRVAIVVDGAVVSSHMLESFPRLTEKLREVGDIKIAEVIYENKLPDQHYQYLTQAGFTNKIVPSNTDLNLLLDTYDLIMEDKIDFVVIASHSDKLIPLYTEIRKKATVFAFVEGLQGLNKSFIESFDGIIEVDKIDEFSFNSTDFDEFDAMLSTNGGLLAVVNGNGKGGNSEIIEDSNYDESNIGIISEDLEEQAEINQIKHKAKVKSTIEKKDQVVKKKKTTKKSVKTKKSSKKTSNKGNQNKSD